jgi:hypothetical protein
MAHASPFELQLRLVQQFLGDIATVLGDLG